MALPYSESKAPVSTLWKCRDVNRGEFWLALANTLIFCITISDEISFVSEVVPWNIKFKIRLQYLFIIISRPDSRTQIEYLLSFVSLVSQLYICGIVVLVAQTRNRLVFYLFLFLLFFYQENLQIGYTTMRGGSQALWISCQTVYWIICWFGIKTDLCGVYCCKHNHYLLLLTK